MRKTTPIRLSEFLALVFALLASRRVRFVAAVLVTALVGVTLSTGSARASGPCGSYWDRARAAPRGSDESILYNTLFNACNWHGVNRAEEIRQTGVCVWYFRQFYNALLRGDRDSEELILYSALWRACFQVGVDRAEEIRQTGACLSDFRRGWKAPSDSDEKSRYFGLFYACVLGGVNRAEAIRQSGACLSYNRKWRNRAYGHDERMRQGNLFKACVRENR